MGEPAVALRSAAPVLGRYRPIRPLGSGGSGSVWLAHDEVTGLDVALKMIAREGRAAARAEREAAAAARLRHPYCLRAYELAHDSRHVYIVYEYVPGRTLREAMRAGVLDDASAVEAAAQILEGLAHAHAHGIVHRDVKPANVILSEGDEISVRILDFGLAVMDHADTLTASGDVPGTLAYVPPERLAGEDASPASDVWAVGVILWEALGGGHPFWRASLLDSAKAIEGGAPPIATVRPDLPKPLAAAIDRALSPDPRDRPSAAMLADVLRGAARRPRAAERPRVRVALDRWLGPGLTALAAGLGASALPFYPGGWPVGLGALAGLAAVAKPRLGLALALAAPLLPLGNLSLGLALLYAGVAAAWLGLFWREPQGGVLPALGPLLGPVGALALAPVAVLRLGSPLRRALAAAAMVLAAAIAAGLRRSPLPLTGDSPPLGLGIAGSDAPGAVADAFSTALVAQPGIAVAATALAAGAALLPYARDRGAWGVCGLGAALMAALLLGSPAIAALPVVAATWAICLPLALRPRH
ncbi:MAG: serine/threonine-protein kinase [Gaiellaceae bacterium]